MAFITSVLLLKLAVALIALSIPVVAGLVVFFDHKAQKERQARDARSQRYWAKACKAAGVI